MITDAFPWLALANVPATRSSSSRRRSAAEAAVDKASFQRIGAQSHLAMPLVVGGRVEGLLAFACLRRQREWPMDLVARVRILADVFSNALAHKRTQEALDSAVRFERTVSAILASLLTTGQTAQPGLIESGLRQMAGVFGVERATLWQRSDDGTRFTKSHRWTVDGVPPSPDSVGIGSLPWISAQVLGGSVVRLSRLSALPPEAAADADVLQNLRIRSGVIVPLAVAGEVTGALSFGTWREDLEWPDELVPRVRIFGEVLANLLTRQAAERREKEAQAQVAHASRVATMGVFASSLVHELTQPIAASLANAESAAELLAAPAPDIDELRSTVADIVADDRRSGELIQQLRRFLRRGEATRTEIDPREAVRQALRLVASQANDLGVEAHDRRYRALPSWSAMPCRSSRCCSICC
jgi:GAF domain-containing protein